MNAFHSERAQKRSRIPEAAPTGTYRQRSFTKREAHFVAARERSLRFTNCRLPIAIIAIEYPPNLTPPGPSGCASSPHHHCVKENP